MDRRLAAILAADVVGFSRLMGADEPGTLTALKVRRKDVLEPLVAKHHGRVFKVTGDGVLVEFGSAVNAVQCAVELQQAMAAANEDQPEERQITLRIGVNLGDVMVEGGDLYGDGVNISARLETIAEPGGILLSGTAYDQVRSKIKIGFEDLGEQSLKNIAEPVRVYRITGAPVVENTSSKIITDKPSIAILPFTNMSGDPEQEYFSDGITEDIITALSQYREFSVIARNSSFHFKGQSPKIRDVSRALGARYIVEGSVRRAGDRVRVTAQLIDSRSGAHIWADRFDRQLKDIFSIQDDITEAVVARVAQSVMGVVANESRSRPTNSVTAYDLLLQSRPHRTAITLTGSREAEKLLRQAIELDPNYALAHSALAFVLVGNVEEGWESDPVRTSKEALDEAKKAVALDNMEGYAHASLAYVYQNFGEFDLALREIGVALTLNPNHPNILMTAGWISIAAGEPEVGISHIEHAQKLNPFMGGFEIWTLGMGYLDAKRYEEAIGAFQQVTNPPNSLFFSMAVAYAYLGRDREARDAMQTYIGLASKEMAAFPGEDSEKWRAHIERGHIRKNRAAVDHIIEGARRAGLPL